ncbi:MAG: DUF927 domain-containing protein [Oscillospiraceae bacterium]|nr:DUF927 domain-containing protein [Oscillospiraceae bacterium]
MFLQTDEINSVKPDTAELTFIPDYDYSAADFATPVPYEKLYELHGSAFIYEMAKVKMEANAKAVGFKSFRGMLQKYEKARLDERRRNLVPNSTDFGDQVMELNCGAWEATDWGIFRDLPNGGRECACAHPIMPISRLVNIDTGEVKLTLWFKRSGRDKKACTTIVDKSTVSTARNITALSSQGISVTSNSASALVDYINDMENLNYDIIQEQKSIGRLGYIPGEGFSPYVEGLVFDGDASFRNLYQSVESKGNHGVWYETAMECRRQSLTARIMLAASFASPILSLVGSLPFFVHLWGVDSGTGKTVALMLAASVWGNPALGSYVQTFNGTQVGQERTAAFLNHLPVCLDELQLTKDSRGKTNFDVYQLAQGVGRSRGKKSGGVELTPTWSCCFLTTGESPLTSISAAAGAVNRVIDIECTAGSAVLTDGQRISGNLKRNYGFAGQIFVDRLYQDEKTQDAVRQIYQDNFRDLCAGDSTEKQAMAAAAIITADFLASQWVFRDDMETAKELVLDVNDIQEFLASKEAVSAGRRAYDWLCDWVGSNVNRFFNPELPAVGDCYGIIENNTAYINRGVFNKVIQEAGYSYAATLSYLKANNLIETRGRAFTKSKRINGIRTECVVLNLQADWDGDYDPDDLLPT